MSTEVVSYDTDKLHLSQKMLQEQNFKLISKKFFYLTENYNNYSDYL